MFTFVGCLSRKRPVCLTFVGCPSRKLPVCFTFVGCMNRKLPACFTFIGCLSREQPVRKTVCVLAVVFKSLNFEESKVQLSYSPHATGYVLYPRRVCMIIPVSLRVNMHYVYLLNTGGLTTSERRLVRLIKIVHNDEWDCLGCSRNSAFRYLLESNKDGFEMHFECKLSPFRIQALIWPHTCTINYKL